jgi:hypothetical protein
MAVIAVVGIGATVASAGVSAYSSNKAGKDAQSAAGAAADRFADTGKRGSDMLKRYQSLLSDPNRVLAMTTNANNNNWADAKSFSQRLNNENISQLHGAINKSLPGYQQLINKSLANTRTWLRGQLPSDVAAAIEDRAAERATNFGLPADSVNRRALTARDLGRTSLDLMSQGENSLQRWISTARSFLTPNMSSPMDFLFTPTQYQNSVLAGANIAGQRAGILTGQQNMATNAYLQGDQAAIAADQAQAQAISQGIESLGGIGMGYANAGAGGGGMMGGFSGGQNTSMPWWQNASNGRVTQNPMLNY